MDNICEQLVAKNRTGADTAKMAGIIIGSILLASVCMFFAMLGLTFLIVIAVGILALGIWLLSGVNVEYEYIITNNEMDIDKIIGRRKRKRMITVDISKATDFGSLPSEKEIDADATVHATSGTQKDAHYLLVEHDSYGTVKVIFNPNERTREAIAHELPHALRARLKNDGK
ncbi:MAG: DUF6106 family protein [Lachnospiraceae bacterium]|nr:DUF6106 family protein [Ruminococcus sp.]MCM1275742.1 DUF6106 family protein [Lachnospiraceae bacterium]